MIRLPFFNSEKSRVCWWQYLFFQPASLAQQKTPNNACTRTAGFAPSKSAGSGFEFFRFANESSPTRRR
jgi:hypothetical protein